MDSSYHSPLKTKSRQAYMEYLIKRANTPTNRVPPPSKPRDSSRISQRNFEYMQCSIPKTPATQYKLMNNSEEKTQKLTSAHFLESTTVNLLDKLNDQIDNLSQAQLLQQESQVQHYHRVELPVKKTMMRRFINRGGHLTGNKGLCRLFFKFVVLVLIVVCLITYFVHFLKREQTMNIQKTINKLK